MMMVITNNCINCGACAAECPTEAIYPPGESREENGTLFTSHSSEHFFIVTSKCDECSGFDKIRCIFICPMDAIRETAS